MDMKRHMLICFFISMLMGKEKKINLKKMYIYIYIERERERERERVRLLDFHTILHISGT
jgi:hypothetical protein